MRFELFGKLKKLTLKQGAEIITIRNDVQKVVQKAVQILGSDLGAWYKAGVGRETALITIPLVKPGPERLGDPLGVFL